MLILRFCLLFTDNIMSCELLVNFSYDYNYGVCVDMNRMFQKYYKAFKIYAQLKSDDIHCLEELNVDGTFNNSDDNESFCKWWKVCADNKLFDILLHNIKFTETGRCLMTGFTIEQISTGCYNFVLPYENDCRVDVFIRDFCCFRNMCDCCCVCDQNNRDCYHHTIVKQTMLKCVFDTMICFSAIPNKINPFADRIKTLEQTIDKLCKDFEELKQSL